MTNIDLKKLPLVSRLDPEGNPRPMTTFRVGGVEIGKDFLMIAGPCSVESREQIMDIAAFLKEAGADMIRGGAYKPRTSP